MHWSQEIQIQLHFSLSVDWPSELSWSLPSLINMNLPFRDSWFSVGDQIRSLRIRLRVLNSGQFTRVMDTSLQSFSNDSLPTSLQASMALMYCVRSLELDPGSGFGLPANNATSGKLLKHCKCLFLYIKWRVIKVPNW